MADFFTDDAFKLASIACKISDSLLPDEADLEAAFELLNASQRFIDSQRDTWKVRDICRNRKWSFDELLHMHTTGSDLVDLGKVSSVRGLKDRIRKSFPSNSQIEALANAVPSNDAVSEMKRELPAEYSEEDYVFAAKIFEVKIEPAFHDYLLTFKEDARGREEIIKSGYVTIGEAFEISFGANPSRFAEHVYKRVEQ